MYSAIAEDKKQWILSQVTVTVKATGVNAQSPYCVSFSEMDPSLDDSAVLNDLASLHQHQQMQQRLAQQQRMLAAGLPPAVDSPSSHQTTAAIPPQMHSPSVMGIPAGVRLLMSPVLHVQYPMIAILI